MVDEEDSAVRVVAVAAELAAWWETNARDLPWRFGRTTPWGVLVSEVMSQQTQMSRVVPYWVAWMERWPSASALAAAPKPEVITMWGRLGYPRRALRLQECARVVDRDCHGELPRAYDALVALPGIGDYTAAAVMSFAFGERIAVIDTNIRRVLSRVFLGVESLGGAASAAERALAARVLPCDESAERAGSAECSDSAGRAVAGHRQVARRVTAIAHNEQGDNGAPTVTRPANRLRDYATTCPSVLWNQSVMELGAMICTAKSPLCDHCPIAAHCMFLAAGRPGLGEKRTRPRQRFQGTDRQVRGIVLAALRDMSSGTALERATVGQLWHDQGQLDACIASLDGDGLIDIHADGSLTLPQ